jgi:protein ImuB
LYRVDHKVMTLTVNAARATRDPNHIVRLFHHRTERLADTFDAGFGIDMIRLAATTVSRLDASQIGAFEHRDGAEDVDRLHDRLASRLGMEAVLRPSFVNTHSPEHSVELKPVLNGPDCDPEAEADTDYPRPLRLLPIPESIRVIATVPDGPPVNMVWRRSTYRFLKAAGPERIDQEWGRADFQLSDRVLLPPNPGETEKREAYLRRPQSNRDYYIAEDAEGRRFWIFREDSYDNSVNPGWYMHGFFA